MGDSEPLSDPDLPARRHVVCEEGVQEYAMLALNCICPAVHPHHPAGAHVARDPLSSVREHHVACSVLPERSRP